MKEQVLHRMRAEFESSGLVVSCKELPTKKLPMVFLRLNEISGSCEKIVSHKSERNAIGIFLL